MKMDYPQYELYVIKSLDTEEIFVGYHSIDIKKTNIIDLALGDGNKKLKKSVIEYGMKRHKSFWTGFVGDVEMCESLIY